ncbi:mitochondrial import inner membrane translocase subunit TIM50-like [Acanthaster planci]|uniref:Mitochondrial import inner membrane translocase subunit TIM50 n=1 Tax=Acanthaster planci TaxID=133434 RepID=A0A8B7XSX9_ACAPL|nr:mitochondrial import inner membrane translocase subunit TIM50-like [Acanthaster planci]
MELVYFCVIMELQQGSIFSVFRIHFTSIIMDNSNMAALSYTCALRNAMRILASKSRNCDLLSNKWAGRPQRNLQHHRRCQTSQFSTCTFSLAEQKQSRNSLSDDSPSGASTLPLSVLLKQAEDKVKEKQQDDEQRKKERKEKFARYQKWALGITGVMLGGASLLTLYELGQPKVDERGKAIPDEFSDQFILVAYIQRAFKEMKEYRTMIVEPSAQKLLPDPLTEPYYQPPYTLVLEMTNVLVHPEWTYSNGWRFKKRPGVDYFLQQVGPPLFEIVIYTSEQGFTGYPLIDNLDPNGYIMYRLFRDATKYMNGHHVKDLSCLNRDMSKVIFVDWNAKSYLLQPQNAFGLKKWEGNDDDRVLVDLADFLRTIAASGVEDVRPVLEHYKQFDDPLGTFKANQARLQAEQERAVQQATEGSAKASSLAGSWTQRLRGR